MSQKESRKKSLKTPSRREIRRSIEARKRKKRYYFLTVFVLATVVIVIILATLYKPQTQKTPAEQTGSLFVHVLDNATDTLLSGANITISGPYAASAVAVDGIHLFESVPVGNYTITASSTGYNQGTVIETVKAGETSHTTVKLSRI